MKVKAKAESRRFTTGRFRNASPRHCRPHARAALNESTLIEDLPTASAAARRPARAPCKSNVSFSRSFSAVESFVMQRGDL